VISLFSSSAVEGLKAGMQGAGQFKQRLTGEDLTVAIAYPEVKEEVTKLIVGMQRVCETAPLDENFK
jgi:hypothetical protein